MVTVSGPPGDGTEEQKGSPPFIAAIGRLAGLLAEAVAEPKEPKVAELSWGRDASSLPSDYWHWQHLRHLYRLDHPDDPSQADLPTEGPLLSIVVPVYRPAIWYFRECVHSVVRQSYQSWELCLCDDGSADDELTEVMAGFAASDRRIKFLVSDENEGISRATNRALSAATGGFVVFLDHDDVLAVDALAEIAAVMASEPEVDVIYSDEDRLDELERPFLPHFKPDWDPDLLLVYPYLGHVTAVRTDVLRRIGGLRPEFDGSQDYDMMLRATEVARSIIHVPKVLYHWRAVAGSAAGDSQAKPWAHRASRRVLEDALVRRRIDGVVEGGPFPGAYHVRRAIEGSPRVSVIVPFRDQAALTLACLDSLDRDPGYEITEVVLIDNGSTEPETRALRQQLERRPRTRLLEYPGSFNWAAINNFAAATCQTDMLLFLNNDIEATSSGWLHALVELGQRPEIGAVGARLVYPDGKLQHAGVVLGLGSVASHIFMGLPEDHSGYFAWDRMVRGYSAVTAACMLTRRSVFVEMGGFDEAFAVAFNDVDFCIRLGQAGYRLLYTPHAELTHYESVSRGLSGFSGDYQEFLFRWMDHIRQRDPSYNPNLSRLQPWCSLRLPHEDEEWLSTMTSLIQVPPVDEEQSEPKPVLSVPSSVHRVTV